MIRPTKLQYDILSGTFIATMHDTDNNQVTEEIVSGEQTHDILHQIDTEFPYPNWDWQSFVEIGTTKRTWQKAMNPS